MKLSNFEWTDKESVKWFVLLPSGHEGPYSLKVLKSRLDTKSISAEAKIWAEGLTDAITLKTALYQFEAAMGVEREKAKAKANLKIVEPVPAPEPVPEFVIPEIPVVVEEYIPPVPMPQLHSEPILPDLPDEDIPELETKAKKNYLPLIGMFSAIVIFLGFLGQAQWIRSQENFSLRRLPKMSPELQERILEEVQFDGWDKKIFFKEYVPADLSRIWFVNSGYQTCEVEASFHSIKGKILTMNNEEVIFKSKTMLKDHVAEFSLYDYQAGQKIIPGLYDVSILARHCQWDGLAPKVANKFNAPDKEYMSKVKMILFPKGASEFNIVLDKMGRKKTEVIVKAQSKDETFWRDLTEKLQTLLAITTQVEQFFIELLEKDARQFDKNLKTGVNEYTQQYGHVLTSFVIANEKDFAGLTQEEIQRVAPKDDYEKVVRLTSKEIGHESMKIIEKLQSLKKPARVRLNEEKAKVSQSFTKLKSKIIREISQIETKAAQP